MADSRKLPQYQLVLHNNEITPRLPFRLPIPISSWAVQSSIYDPHKIFSVWPLLSSSRCSFHKHVYHVLLFFRTGLVCNLEYSHGLASATNDPRVWWASSFRVMLPVHPNAMILLITHMRTECEGTGWPGGMHIASVWGPYTVNIYCNPRIHKSLILASRLCFMSRCFWHDFDIYLVTTPCTCNQTGRLVYITPPSAFVTYFPWVLSRINL